MPDYGAITETRSRRRTTKERVANKMTITKEEKKQEEVSFTVTVKRKILDGKSVKSMCISKYGWPDGSYAAEYTDEKAFSKQVAECVSQAIDAI